MKQFNLLKKPDVERLRRKSTSVAVGSSVNFDFSPRDVMLAKKHLERLYTGYVTEPFVARILLLNAIY